MKFTSCFVALLILLTTLSTGVNAQTPPNVFTFTAIPDEDESRLRSRFDKVATYLSEQLGTPVKYVPVKSYSAAITAFRNNQVQLAWFGGLSGVKARHLVPDSTAIAQGYEDQFFKTYFIAHHSTQLSLGDSLTSNIAGLTFTFGAKGSTSGRLMPEHYLRQQFNQSPREIFKRVGFSGNHSQTIAQVQSGAWQLGAVNYKVWESELASGKIDPNKVNVIWSTPTYPDYQWTIRNDVNHHFGSDFVKRVQVALLAMNNPALLASFPRKKFVSATNDDYAPIKKVAKAIKLL
ncbi:MAG: putative selenate ABC transporter substrate-binding protein [Psychrobium sp.]|nr:putative selenate ABC transporter substrate-binding protein [Psychrobium sp.]